MTTRPTAQAPMTVGELLRRPTGYLPLAMSLGALAMIAWYLTLHGVARQPDEGAQAHLWQLLVGAQLLLIPVFALTWLPRAGRPALIVMALQVAAVALLAVAPLWALGGL